MDQFIIEGGRKIEGEATVLGVKNGILPMMAAAILAEKGETVISNVPDLRDIKTLSRVLSHLGARVNYDPRGKRIAINCEAINNFQAPYDLVKQMRASFLVIGPLLARFHKAEVSLPGGCAIGARSVNMHIDALRKFGATIIQEDGLIKATSKRLKGTIFHFDIPTHTGTENIMMAACLATGKTRLINAACEPEIKALAEMLNSMGAEISGAGTPVITIEGVEKLSAAQVAALPSRIETAFYMAAAAITNGEVIINNAILGNLGILVDKLREMGLSIRELSNNRVLVKGPKRLSPVNFTTWPFPGFPTDFQAQMMALATVARGTSFIKETVFENRFMHVNELIRLGANIKINLNEATVEGVKRLKGSPIMASDLQAGAGLVLAALSAEGVSVLDRIYHIDRGYEKIEQKLAKLGASIKRFSPKD